MSVDIVPIPGYAAYGATCDGKIFRMNSGREMGLRKTYQGYQAITLSVKGRSIPKLVHTLVLLAFKGGPPQDDSTYSCDHIDRDRSNNCISNLRWATPKEQRHNSSLCLDTGKERLAMFRPVIVTDKDGCAVAYPRVANALSVIAPHVHPTNKKVYEALKTSGYAFEHTWEYAPPPAGLFRVIPPEFIHGAQGYQVSDTGFVMTPTGRTYRGTLGRGREYYCVNIHKHIYRVHRLVAAAFLDMDSAKPWVNHKNGVKTDNSLENLEWVDASENALHAIRMELKPIPPGRSVEQWSLQGTHLMTHVSVGAAARHIENEKGRSNIGACCRGRQQTAYGYVWKYTK